MAKMLLELLLGVSGGQRWVTGAMSEVSLYCTRVGMGNDPSQRLLPLERATGEDTLLTLRSGYQRWRTSSTVPVGAPGFSWAWAPRRLLVTSVNKVPLVVTSFMCAVHTHHSIHFVLPAATFTTTRFLNFPTPFPLPTELLASKQWVQGRKEKDQCSSPATRKHIQEVTLEKVMKKQIAKQPKRDGGITVPTITTELYLKQCYFTLFWCDHNQKHILLYIQHIKSRFLWNTLEWVTTFDAYIFSL